MAAVFNLGDCLLHSTSAVLGDILCDDSCNSRTDPTTLASGRGVCATATLRPEASSCCRAALVRASSEVDRDRCKAVSLKDDLDASFASALARVDFLASAADSFTRVVQHRRASQKA